MASALDQLNALIPPPRSASSAPDWAAIEQRLRLPADYKRLVEDYGSGAFDDFIRVLQPSETNEHIDLLRQRKVRLDALRALHADGEFSPYRIERDHEAVVPWAITDNGTECLVALLSKSIRVGLLPEDFPSEQPTFRAASR